MYILGISAFYHDSAATLLLNGRIVSAVQEERFTRIKHDSQFPRNAVQYCLTQAQIDIGQVEAVVFYEKPILKLDRILETHLASAPWGFANFKSAIPLWMKQKLFMKSHIITELRKFAGSNPNYKMPKILFSEHHQAHAASAFFASPFQEAAVLCVDGVGEWATTSVWHGRGNSLQAKWELQFPHSLGLLYSAFTYYAGFKVNSGEYKLMGLAPYGKPIYAQKILDHIVDIKDDGTFRLNMQYFDFLVGNTMTSEKFHELFDGPPRKPESALRQKDMDLARSIQEVTEMILLRLTKAIHQELQTENLCLAGGVALNCVANSKLRDQGLFKNIWVQPAAGDAGGSLGAALAGWHQYYGKERSETDLMRNGCWGPSFTEDNIRRVLSDLKIESTVLENESLYQKTATLLNEQHVVGWFQGAAEFGPRALGSRSILADPRNPAMQSQLNQKIKLRESFRPFAPIVLKEKVGDYFAATGESPYMMFVSETKSADLPAITHVDKTARVQTVSKNLNQGLHQLLTAFHDQTGCGVLINTSFNVRGEPIVNSIEDAINCFLSTDIDDLMIGTHWVSKKNIKPEHLNKDRKFELD